MKKDPTAKYLSQWAEPECPVLDQLLDQTKADKNASRSWVTEPRQSTIITPAFDEPNTWWQSHSQALSEQTIWWIWVFNAPDTLTNDAHYAQQAAALLCCKQHLRDTLSLGSLTIGRLNEQHHVLLVDRFTHPIPGDQGVGLARKIGSDLALVLINKGLVKTPWLCNTDADADLPRDMLTDPSVKKRFVDPTIGAFQFGFKHVPAHAEYAESTWCYDQYLRYHFRGLQQARSPYAYTTIGSLLAASAKHYAAVRGFPKQSAGEDFYLLNKIKKISEVQTLETPIITLSGRPSHRVPYGTGPTLSRWQTQDRHTTQVWSPKVYTALESLLNKMSEYFLDRSAITNTAKCFTKAPLERFPKEISYGLCKLGFERWFSRARLDQIPHPEQRLRSFHQWFDALKTQQFIRLLAENEPSITIATAANYWTHSR